MDCLHCSYKEVCDFEKTGNCEVRNETKTTTFKVRLAPSGKVALAKVLVDDSRGSEYGDN